VPSTIDMVEHTFGASNTNAVVGHGGLTAGISRDGDLTVLSWPGPTFADQLAYLSGNDLDVRSEPHLGAADGMGSYLGLLVTTAAGVNLTWLRDPAFTVAQRYTQPDSAVAETTFRRSDLGLSVTLTDFVNPTDDLLTRRVRVTRGPGSPVLAASLVVYENLSPSLSKIPMLPFGDWALDAMNDFVAIYDRGAHAVVHVHPGDRGVVQSIADLGNAPERLDYGPIDALMRKSPSDADVDALLASMDSAFAPGVAAYVTTDPPPTSFQVGSDATPICERMGRLVDNVKRLPAVFPSVSLPVDPGVADALRCTDALPKVRTARGWTWAPVDALADLADGTLENSPLAAGQTNAALIAPLTFTEDVAEASALFAFGASVAAAHDTLTRGTTLAAGDRQRASEARTHDLLGTATLPDPALGDRVREVALRALVNVYVARDRTTGAIAASISRQPPYALDWPRDGAFITNALDIAGLTSWGTQRAAWYGSLQRLEPTRGNPLLTPHTTVDPDTGEEEFPAFAWETNYFADGTLGGSIRFEIDNTALHVWAMVSHAARLRGGERAAFIATTWPTLKNPLHLLARWRDKETALPWPANEDDHFEVTSTLHGAPVVYAALLSGARLAHAAGDEAAGLEAESRAKELHDAILRTYYDAKTGRFHDTAPEGADYIPGTAGVSATAWVAWPGHVLADDDPRLDAQLAADMAAILPSLRGETAGGAYFTKTVVAAALLGTEGGSRRMAREAVSRLAGMATEGTSHFGEVFVTSHPPGAASPVFSQRVAGPHVWEGILFYLAAMALSDRSTFDPERTELPLPVSSEATRSDSCALSPGSSVGLGLLPIGAALAVLIALRRRQGLNGR